MRKQLVALAGLGHAAGHRFCLGPDRPGESKHSVPLRRGKRPQFPAGQYLVTNVGIFSGAVVIQSSNGKVIKVVIPIPVSRERRGRPSWFSIAMMTSISWPNLDRRERLGREMPRS